MIEVDAVTFDDFNTLRYQVEDGRTSYTQFLEHSKLTKQSKTSKKNVFEGGTKNQLSRDFLVS